MKPILIILNGERAGERLILEDSKRYILGRDQTTDICLPEKKISRKHATLCWEKAAQRIVVEDLGSLNGTTVNGEVISTSQILTDGDRLQLGSYVLQIQIPESTMPSLDPVETDRKPKSAGRHTEPEPKADESGARTGGRIISGKIEEISLADLLQMLSTTKKSGRLILSDDRLVQAVASANVGSDVAILYLNEGDIEHAIYNRKTGQDAFFACLKKVGGYFALFSLDEEDSYTPTITMPLEALLLEGFRRMDEERANQSRLTPQDIFEAQPDEPLNTLSPQELMVFQAVWKHKRLAAILDNSSASEAETIDLLKKLLRGGFVKKSSKN